MKFGGTSMKDLKAIRSAASHVHEAVKLGKKVVVVVSAQAGETDRLMGLMNNYSQHISHIAMDMVVSAGEQIAAGLMVQVLHDIGLKAVPLTGCQAGIVTNNIHANATISKIKTENILRVSASGVIPIITGFQGITSEGLISTLGRGGSDTSAVELAKALGAEACEIYTDVQGVFSLDPRLSKNARIFTRISHLEMFEMSTLGAKVLHKRAAYAGMVSGVKLFIKQTGSSQNGTVIAGEQTFENPIEAIITSSRKSTLSINQSYKTHDALQELSDHGIAFDMLHSDSESHSICCIDQCDKSLAENILERSQLLRRERSALSDNDLMRVSTIGNPAPAHLDSIVEMIMCHSELHKSKVSHSEIRRSGVSVTVEAEYASILAQILHDNLQKRPVHSMQTRTETVGCAFS